MDNRPNMEDLTRVAPLIHPETGNEIKKQFFVSVPYFPGLSEVLQEDLQIRTHTVFVSRGVNTLKSLLQVSTEQKDVVYHLECQADGCNSSYVGETSQAPQGEGQGTL